MHGNQKVSDVRIKMNKWLKVDGSLLIASLALAVSLVTFVSSTLREQSAGERATKIRLIQQIDNFYVQAGQAFLDGRAEANPEIRSVINGLWETRKKIITDDMLWLAHEVPEQITSAEYSTLAAIFTDINRHVEAKTLAETSVEHAAGPRDRAAAKQRLARVLFASNNKPDFVRARSLFQETIDYYSGSKFDQDTLSSGFAYGNWADLEGKQGNVEESLRLTRLSIQQYSKVSSYNISKAQLAVLNHKLSELIESTSHGPFPETE